MSSARPRLELAFPDRLTPELAVWMLKTHAGDAVSFLAQLSSSHPHLDRSLAMALLAHLETEGCLGSETFNSALVFEQE
jgi:hypothetical protein